ncbi:unnamed protein product [Allacma fusca]|uniref:Gustatory receptor n=1 Tax=Allacma fusca TaxID=39272 RepID=A0A8J2JJL8_9HEXA|nr:unnamed protein product [Allacma fusca]
MNPKILFLSEIEERLLQFGQPFMHFLSFAGFHSVVIKTGSSEGLKYQSFALPWAILNLTLLILGETFYTIVIHPTVRAKYNLGLTENFTYILVSFSTVLSFLALKALAILKYKENSKFWSENVRMLMEFSQVGPQFDLRSEHLDPFFETIRQGVRRNLIAGLFYMFYCMIIVCALIWIAVANDSKDFPLLISNLHHVQSLIWNINFSMYFLFGLFLGLYLKMYITCLQVIAIEVERIVITQNREAMLSNNKDIELGPKTIFKKQFNMEQTIERLEQILKAYFITEELVTKFSRHFETELFITFVSSFLIIFARAFFIVYYILKSSPTDALYMTGTAVVYVWQIYHVATLCSQLDEQVKRILVFLHRVDVKALPIYLHTKIDMLAVRLAGEPLTISPRQCFKLDRKLLITMLASVATYLIILIQFQTADERGP